MPALDPVVAADNIRFAVIHPPFAGALTDRWTGVFQFNYNNFPRKSHRNLPASMSRDLRRIFRPVLLVSAIPAVLAIPY
jgi:hypothetical protein